MTGTRMQAPPTEEQRRAVEALVSGAPGGRAADRSFSEPWEIRAVALAVTAHQRGCFEWSAFQAALIESIRDWESGAPDPERAVWSYYGHWLAALERVLVDVGDVEPSALAQRVEEVRSTPLGRDHQMAHLDPVAVDPARR